MLSHRAIWADEGLDMFWFAFACAKYQVEGKLALHVVRFEKIAEADEQEIYNLGKSWNVPLCPPFQTL